MTVKRHPPHRQLLFDFHTMPGNPDIGKNFDFQKIGDYFESCCADSVMFPFRCNQGYSYYPTEVGIMYPGLQYDLLGRMMETCRDRGIQCLIYTNAVVCVEAGQRHPEWLKRTLDFSAHDNTICSNSPFTQMLCDQIREVTGKYNPDGLFLDFGYDPPCICENCKRLMKEEGIDWEYDPDEHKAFALRSSMKKYRAFCKAALERDPEILLCINGIPYEEKADYSTHFEFECLPTASWGYHQLPVYSHYIRTIGKPVSNMTGRFHGGWGDFGGLRPQASLEYDVFYGLANGMNTTIGSHFHPRGDMYTAVMDLVSSTMQKLKAVDEWTIGADPQAEIGVIVPKAILNRETGSLNAVTGAARMLIELKYQFDILSDELPFRKDYKVLILPDETRITPALKKRLRQHLDHNGKVISSMYSGLAEHSDKKIVSGMASVKPSVFTANQNACAAPEFASDSAPVLLADPNDYFVFQEWGVTYTGIAPFDPLFMESEKIDDFPSMPVTVIARSSFVQPARETEVLADYIAPYFNRQPKNVRFFQYLPPEGPCGQAAVTMDGQVAHIAFPIFAAYFDSARLEYRKIIAHILRRFIPEPIVRAPNALSFVKIFVTKQKKRTIVHILSGAPEKRTPQLEVIEDQFPIHNMKLEVSMENVFEVYTAPEKQNVDFVVNGKYVCFTVPDFCGHIILILEQHK